MIDTPAVTENHCPFGCTTEDLDEHGYCRHLVGFTNNGKTYEAQIRGPRGLRQVDAIEFDPNTGRTRRKLRRVGKADVLVNPVTPQLDMGVWHDARKWVSDRVYRQGVPMEKRDDELVMSEWADHPQDAENTEDAEPVGSPPAGTALAGV